MYSVYRQKWKKRREKKNDTHAHTSISTPQSGVHMRSSTARNSTQQRIKRTEKQTERERERDRQRKKKIRRNNNTSTILRDDWWISRMLYSLWVIIYGTYILKNISVLCYDVTSKKCSIEIFVGLYVYTGWLIHKNEWKKTSNTNKSSMCFVWCFCCCCFCSYYCCCPLLLVLFYIYFFSVYFQLSCKFSFSFLVKNSICFFFVHLLSHSVHFAYVSLRVVRIKQFFFYSLYVSSSFPVSQSLFFSLSF